MVDHMSLGWKEVIIALKEMNVPKEYIHNTRALQHQNAEHKSLLVERKRGGEEHSNISTEVILRTHFRQRLRPTPSTLSPHSLLGAFAEYRFWNRIHHNCYYGSISLRCKRAGIVQWCCSFSVSSTLETNSKM